MTKVAKSQKKKKQCIGLTTFNVIASNQHIQLISNEFHFQNTTGVFVVVLVDAMVVAVAVAFLAPYLDKTGENFKLPHPTSYFIQSKEETLTNGSNLPARLQIMLTILIRILFDFSLEHHSLEHHFRNWQLNVTQLLEGIYQKKKKNVLPFYY